MDLMTLLPAVISTLGEAGPWLAFAGAALALYIRETRKNERLEKKMDEREDASRRLAMSLAGVNAKNLNTLASIKDVLVRNEAALNKSGARLEHVEDRVRDAENKLDDLKATLVEICTLVRKGGR